MKKQMTTQVLLIGILGVLVIGGILLGNRGKVPEMQVQPRKEKDFLSVTPTKPIEPLLRLSLEPSLQTLVQGEKMQIAVKASSQQPVLAIDLYLQYDPAYLQFTSVKPGSYFTDPMIFAQKADVRKGMIFFALGALKQPNASGTLLLYNFVARKKGSATVSLLPTTVASVKGAQKAAIHAQNTLTISVKE